MTGLTKTPAAKGERHKQGQTGSDCKPDDDCEYRFHDLSKVCGRWWYRHTGKPT